MMKVLRDDDESERLREAGLKRAAKFTWKKTAKQTAAVYRRVVGREV